MKREELQKLLNIDGKTSSQMLAIAKSYLQGDVVRDLVAAEAWLMRVMEEGDSPEAVHAMELLAGEILKKDVVVSREDYEAMLGELEQAGAEEREVIEELVKLHEKMEINEKKPKITKKAQNNKNMLYK